MAVIQENLKKRRRRGHFRRHVRQCLAQSSRVQSNLVPMTDYVLTAHFSFPTMDESEGLNTRLRGSGRTTPPNLLQSHQTSRPASRRRCLCFSLLPLTLLFFTLAPPSSRGRDLFKLPFCNLQPWAQSQLTGSIRPAGSGSGSGSGSVRPCSSSSKQPASSTACSSGSFPCPLAYVSNGGGGGDLCRPCWLWL